MTEPHSSGAFARAAIVASCLLLIEGFALAPRAHAGARSLSELPAAAWPAMPGGGYRAELDPFANRVRGAARIGDGLTSVIAPARNVVAGLVADAAAALGVPVRLALAIAHLESGFRMSMHGAAGERGAMQVLPQTARQVGVTGNLYGTAGVEAGVRYLKLALSLHGHAGWCAVASAYNTGVWRGSHCTRYGRAIVALAALR